MLWGILLHSGVLRAKDIGDTFHKMIRVGDRRLNITLLMSLQAHLPCWYEEVMPTGLSCTHGADPRPLTRKPVLLPRHRPRVLLHFILGACLLHCPDLGPLWLPRARGRTSLLNLTSLLPASLCSQRASHCLWNCFSVPRFPVPLST